MDLVKDYMDVCFQKLSQQLKPIDAITQLQNDAYGIVENERHEPIAIIKANELQQTLSENAESLFTLHKIFRPVTVVEQTIEMQAVVDVFMTAIEESKVALIINVIDDVEQVVGILPIEIIDDYMINRQSQYKGPTMSGSESYGGSTGLGGSQLGGLRQSLSRRQVCFERGCGGHVNRFTVFEWQNTKQKLASGVQDALPKCQNPDPTIAPHPLKLP